MDTIDVFEMARVGSSVDGSIAIADMPRLAQSLVRVQGALRYRCEGRMDEQGRPALELRMTADLPVLCDRCGGELDLALRAKKSFFFVHTEDELAAIPIDALLEEEALIGSSQFDLASLIEDEAILHLPISPRHEACVAAGTSAVTRAEPDRPHPFASLVALRERLRSSRPSPRRTPPPASAGTKRPAGSRKPRRPRH